MDEIFILDWILLKNKKYLGKKISPHLVKNRLIQEIDKKSQVKQKTSLIEEIKESKSSKTNSDSPALISEVSSKKITKENTTQSININYQIQRVPENGDIKFLLAEFLIPQAVSCENTWEIALSNLTKKKKKLTVLYLLGTHSGTESKKQSGKCKKRKSLMTIKNCSNVLNVVWI